MAALTMTDTSNGEEFHYWPQVLPGANFLFFVRNTNAELTWIYAASLKSPRKAVQLVRSADNALFAPESPGSTRGYLLWLRDATLMAQEFDAASLRLSGEPHAVAEPVAGFGLHGQMEASVSANGVLLYQGIQ